MYLEGGGEEREREGEGRERERGGGDRGGKGDRVEERARK